MQSSSVLRRYEFKRLVCVDKPIWAGGKVMTLVAVIAVLGWGLDVALALAAKLPRLALDSFLTFLWCHFFLLVG